MDLTTKLEDLGTPIDGDELTKKAADCNCGPEQLCKQCFINQPLTYDPAALASMAVKLDAGKPRPSLIPAAPLLHLAALYTIGATKYADHNWRKGLTYSRCADALLRHFYAWLGGEDYDTERPEQKLHHMAAVAFYAFAIMEYHFRANTLLDDRYKESV